MNSVEGVSNLVHQPAGDATGGFELGAFPVHGFQKLLPCLAHEGDIREVHRDTAIYGVRGEGTPCPFQFVHPRTGESALQPEGGGARVLVERDSQHGFTSVSYLLHVRQIKKVKSQNANVKRQRSKVGCIEGPLHIRVSKNPTSSAL